MKVAFQGVKGANSEEAARAHFKESIEPLGLDHSEDVVQYVLEGKAAMGILPVENSIVGNVSVNLDLFFLKDIKVIGEVYHSIQHHLMTVPGVSLEGIHEVISHPVALAQCREFIQKQKWGPISHFDTAGACRDLSEKKWTHRAAIGPRMCAEYYGLNIQRDDIQGEKRNFTRFFVFVDKNQDPLNLRQEKTSLIFSSGHTPGALLDCLEVFKFHGLNLTKLESRPIPQNPFQYVFFVDFTGGLQDEEVQDCLKHLKKRCEFYKIIGSYPRAKFSFQKE